MRNRVALLACLVSLAPALASAQTAGAIVVTEVSGDVLDKAINLAECKSTDLAGGTLSQLSLGWLLGSTPVSGTTLTVWASDTSACPPTSANKVALAAGLVNTTVAAPSSGSWNTGTDILRKSGSTWTLNCDPATGTTTIYLCVSIEPGTSGGTAASGATGSIVLDRTVPKTPVVESITPGDGALHVRWSAGTSGGSGTTADYTVTATGGGQTKIKEHVTGLDWRLDGLTNDVAYSVTVTAYTQANNPSAVSAALTGTPVPVDDFWDRYQAAQGDEQGGCSGGPASALALLVLATAAPRLRRRRP